MNGLTFEKRLVEELRALNCEIEQSQEFDHKRKVDFVMTTCCGVKLCQPLEAQTTQRKDREKLTEYLRYRGHGRRITSLYIENSSNRSSFTLARLITMVAARLDSRGLDVSDAMVMQCGASKKFFLTPAGLYLEKGIW